MKLYVVGNSIVDRYDDTRNREMMLRKPSDISTTEILKTFTENAVPFHRLEDAQQYAFRKADESKQCVFRSISWPTLAYPILQIEVENTPLISGKYKIISIINAEVMLNSCYQTDAKIASPHRRTLNLCVKHPQGRLAQVAHSIRRSGPPTSLAITNVTDITDIADIYPELNTPSKVVRFSASTKLDPETRSSSLTQVLLEDDHSRSDSSSIKSRQSRQSRK